MASADFQVVYMFTIPFQNWLEWGKAIASVWAPRLWQMLT